MNAQEQPFPIQEIIDYLKKGCSYAEIRARFPGLSESEIKSYHHQALQQENLNHIAKPVYCKLQKK